MMDITNIIKKFDSYAGSHLLVYRIIGANDMNHSTKYIKDEIGSVGIFYDNGIYIEPVEAEINNVKFAFQTYHIIREGFDEKITTIYSENQSNIDDLLDYLDEKYNSNKCKMYVWNQSHYSNSNYDISYVDENNLVGLTNFFSFMEKEIMTIKQNKELATLMGASSGYNYYTYGPPGTGKTSSFKALGHKLGVPVYSVNLSLIQQFYFKFALSPNNNDDELKIVIVEDFDRYITDVKNISELLNALDGVHSSYGTIRIFSANSPEITLKDRALRSRMKKFIKFDLPNADKIYQHLMNISNGDEENSKLLSFMFETKNVSYREINNYVSQFITEPSLLAVAIKNFGDWMKENDDFNMMSAE